MGTRPPLSICIPTYNFGKYIGETLESIVQQRPLGVQIVVVDGASTDRTSDVVQSFLQRYDDIRYERLTARGGIDRDMSRCVDLSDGEYCWLFSADDRMRPGALPQVLQAINSGSDVYVCRHSNCTLDMRVINEHPLLRADATGPFRLERLPERLEYFKLAANTEAFFSFMSGLVVRRSAWSSVALNEAFVGSCWAHVARLFELIGRTGLSVECMPGCLVDRRGENDSFANRGVVNRLAIAVDGYQALAARFFGARSTEAFHIRRALRAEFGLRSLLHARLLCRSNPHVESGTLLDKLVATLHCDNTIGCIARQLVYSLTPLAPYAALRKIYRAALSATVRL